MNRALLIVDLQRSFEQRPNWTAISDPGVIGKVQRLLDAARAEGDLVVWVLHSEPGTGNVFDPARGYVALLDGLTPRAGEPVVTKTSINAFTTTNLQQMLTTRGIREVVVCGIQTEQCCETTARVASDLGFDVTFVTDATATFPIAHRDAPADRSIDEVLADPTTLSTDEVISRTEYALAGRFAAIKSVDDLTAR